MGRRTYVLLAAVLAATATSAVAKPTVSCRIMRDVTGDETPYDPVQHPVDRPELDLVSGDVATDSTSMTTVVRVRALPAMPLPGIGASYNVIFAAGGRSFQSKVVTGFEGDYGTLSTYDIAPTGTLVTGVDLPDPVVVVDRPHNEVRATFPLAALQPYATVRRGAWITIVRMVSYLEAGTSVRPTTVAGQPLGSNAGLAFDHGTGGAMRYRAGDPSCVRVGR